MTRREQWNQFYTAALAGTADPRGSGGDPDAITASALDIADAAMARLDARDFPEPKVQALLLAARNVWKSANHLGDVAIVPAHLMATLGAAIHDMETEQ